MKTVICWACKEKTKIRKEDRQQCDKCGSPYWKSPSVFKRLSWGFGAFWKAFTWKPRRHSTLPTEVKK